MNNFLPPMKYFLVVGEASGDLHASNLMRALRQKDPESLFAFMGGPLMREEGGECIVRSEDMAFMGIVDVIKHLGTIREAARKVQSALLEQKPDVVICVDYAGFCFKYVLPFAKKYLPSSKVVYYIPPKVWAWKKHRINKLRTHTDMVLCIFPFEVDFFSHNNLPQARYVGNPTMESVQNYLNTNPKLEPSQPSIALLCGSRQSEIKQNLPAMLRAGATFPDYKLIIAAAPGVPKTLYERVIAETGVEADLVFGDTYGVVRQAKVALVTSGTATLETALLGTPQVVCYAVRGGGLANFLFKNFFTIPHISLVNLVASKEVVQELYGGLFTERNITQALTPLLHDSPERKEMLQDYKIIEQKLITNEPAAHVAATLINSISTPFLP